MMSTPVLSSLLGPLQATLVGDDRPFSSVSTDSRGVTSGQLFVALRGERFDGHDYTAAAEQADAAAVMVDHVVEGCRLPQLIVTDTLKALGRIGAWNRSGFVGPVSAVTGSSGKTTVKEMVHSILSLGGETLATQGNLNNEIGVPLTLLRLNPVHRAAVIELGASHVGEIAYTAGLAAPQSVLITNAGTAHVGIFGSRENIVRAKGEILDCLPDAGTAVLNLDDPAFDYWQSRVRGGRVLSFSCIQPQADFFASEIRMSAEGSPEFILHALDGQSPVRLGLLGGHNVGNALGAAALAHAMGADMAQIVRGLERLTPIRGRGQMRYSRAGSRVVDDTYNANPASVKAAVDLLSGFQGRRVLVLGDMGELGEWQGDLHRDIGDYASGKVDELYAVGPLSRYTVKAFGKGAQHCQSREQLVEQLVAEDDGHRIFLIKGSRSAGMEAVVASLCGQTGENH